MQIIIVQSEIEEAIRNHILSQITVREDMQIDIDLSATRGPQGFTATIDIRKADQGDQATGTNKSDTGSHASETAGKSSSDSNGSSETSSTSTTRAPRGSRSNSKASSSDSASESGTASEGTASEGTASEGAASSEEAPPATGAGKSLFGNLSRPTNEPKAEASSSAE